MEYACVSQVVRGESGVESCISGVVELECPDESSSGVRRSIERRRSGQPAFGG
jgi:hypothetical protein